MDQFERHERVNIDTSHLIFTAHKMIGFFMKCNTGRKWVEFQRENKLHIKGPINDIIKACYRSMIFKVDHFQAKTI